MNRIKIITCLVGLMMISTFSIAQSEASKKIVGTYGEKFIHQLTLNEDNTFQYIRVLNNEKMKVNGEWVFNDGNISLIDSTNEKNVIKKWKVKNNTSCLKAKKGLAIYTLCKKCD